MNKNISVIGVGKLGLCLSLNLEKKGYNILGIDINKEYITQLNNKTFNSSEPLVNDFLLKSKNIKFTTDISKSIENDIIFIVVNTPSTKEWKYDHSQIDSIINNLILFGPQKNRKDLIINCTTFPGYCETLQEKLKDYNYKVSYNPEFISQGSIIKDQINPDNVLIGESDKYSGDLIEEIYVQMCESNPIINRMSVTEAEITKLSVNCFLTTKISYANMIGDISIRYNCNPETILKAIGTDSRIGGKYLNYGFGFGGPCFPRDNRSLSKCAEDVGVDASISKATDIMNENHLNYQVEDFLRKNPDKTKEVVFEFLTYKKESVLLEESQQLKFALKLKELGYKIKNLDNRKEVINQLKNIL
jgi:nucleotide sugar dehydrogenase